MKIICVPILLIRMFWNIQWPISFCNLTYWRKWQNWNLWKSVWNLVIGSLSLSLSLSLTHTHTHSLFLSLFLWSLPSRLWCPHHHHHHHKEGSDHHHTKDCDKRWKAQGITTITRKDQIITIPRIVTKDGKPRVSPPSQGRIRSLPYRGLWQKMESPGHHHHHH